MPYVLDLAQTSLCEDPLSGRKRKGIVSRVILVRGWPPNPLPLSLAASAARATPQWVWVHDTHLCVDVGDLLDRAPVARASVLGGDDATISALSELLHELVLRIDDERRVESGKTVPLHGGAPMCHLAFADR